MTNMEQTVEDSDEVWDIEEDNSDKESLDIDKALTMVTFRHVFVLALVRNCIQLKL